MKLQTHDLSCFLGRKFYGDDGFQNIFVYQPLFSMLELRKDKGTDYAFGWKSKGFLESKLLLLHSILDTK